MIDRETIQYIEPALKYSIKKYFSLKEKTLLYDMLVFCSIVSKTKMFCSTGDLFCFQQLVDNCKQLSIPLENYISCAYSYIQKYTTPGHRLGISYFLNENVVAYCGTKLEGFNSSSLLIEQIKEDILSTEKTIRNNVIETGCSYNTAFNKLLKLNRVSPGFLAYKRFCLSPLVASIDSAYFESLLSVLEPFFTYIMAKNNVYSLYKLQKWNNSKLEDFSFCPIYFTDRYVTNELVDDVLGNEATSQGTRLHSIFETIIKRYTKSKTKNLKKAAERYFATDEYKETKKVLPEHIPFIESLFLDDSSILHKLITHNSILFTERTMTSVLSGKEFYGTADLIIINGSDGYVLDWKSSKLDPKYISKNNAKYNKQISLYAKLLKQDYPNLTSLTGIIVYTRGLVHTFTELNDSIADERVAEIHQISKILKSGILLPNKNSCFLCRHPACKFRGKESIWDSQGNRKNSN